MRIALALIAMVPGDTSVKLESFRVEAPLNVGAATIEAAERPDFAVPATSGC